ncbi:hypothetical protein Cni_G03127 [Canna indica]|uniref:Transmembrane protein n=1 Tax=Canna indica TaxID=4628 RepID=A0AAQ3Q0U5_9LILI|nr:hypothetical protein Cni_G03127 [Canna indica]
MKSSALRTPRRPPSAPALQTSMRIPSTSALQIPSSTPSHGCGFSLEPLTPRFSADPEEVLTLSDIETLPGAKSTVEDELESLISVPITEKLGSQGSVEIPEEKSAAAADEKVETEIASRLRQALLEVRRSKGVSGESKKLLDALIEVAIRDVGADRCEDSHLMFLAKARIWIVCFLILMVAVMNLMAISVVFDGDGGQDFSGLLHPT